MNDITPLTPQQAFDLALQGIRGQDYQRSVNHGALGACAYRGDNGLKCAVGHMIPAALYSPTMEGAVIGNLLRMPQGEALRQLLGSCSPAMLSALQRVHDTFLEAGPHAFEDHMAHIALGYGLTYTPPTVEIAK